MNEGYIVIVAMALAFLAIIWSERKRKGYPQSDEESESDDDDSGGGRWNKPPKGHPPGGPDRDLNQEFHAVADVIGKTIEIEKKNEEKVLT